jgi:MFS family permease
MGLLFYPKESKSLGKIDLPGTILFGLSVSSFFIGIQEGRNRGYLNPIILSCFIGFFVSFLLFIRLQKKQVNPLLDMGIFKSKWFTISIFCAFTSYMAISCYNLLQPFYLQKVLQMSPATSGIIMTIYPLIIVLISPISGFLSDRIAGEKLTLIGLGFTCLGLFLMSSLSLLTPLALIILYVGIMAMGNGFFQSPNNSIVMSSLAPKDYGVGGSINALARTIGQTTGIAISNILLYTGMSWKLNRHVTDIIPGQESAFLFGMKMAYICAGVISLIGFLVTLIRLYHFLHKVKSQEVRNKK